MTKALTQFDAPGDRAVEFKLRMRRQLHARLVIAAKANGRSLNSEIIDRLERSLAGADEQ